MKPINRHSLTLLNFVLILILAISCENRDDELFSEIDEEINKNVVGGVNGSLVNCQVLNDIHTNNQVTAANNFKPAFDQYMNCGSSTPVYSGSCCAAQTVYLTANGGYSNSFVRFELWRPWYVAGSGVDYLVSGNVLSKSEQLDFIERAADIANSIHIACNGGQLIPETYSLEVRAGTYPNSNFAIANVAVRVTYTPVCYFSFP